MAVIVKYIVVRNGEEKMTFATKKEADAHDKMLDIADNLFDFLESAKIKLAEAQLEEISLIMAQKREELVPILRGGNPGKKVSSKPATKPASKPVFKEGVLPKKIKTKGKTKIKAKQ
ncbi:MAG: YebG family protein [Desulfobacteraceae bacterium]|nr:YebG family protein [Desulfobacteraceae bacterium]